MEEMAKNNTKDNQFIGYDSVTFGENLEDNRKRLGLSQKELSEILKENYNISLSPRMISVYENISINSVISVDKVIALADIFGIKVETLLGCNINVKKKILASELGLNDKVIKKLKQFVSLSKPQQTLFQIVSSSTQQPVLFKTEKKSIMDFTIKDIFNFLIGDTKLIEEVNSQTKKVLERLSKHESTRITLENELKSIIEKIQNEPDIEKVRILKKQKKDIRRKINKFYELREDFIKECEAEINLYFNKQFEKMLNLILKNITF